MKTIASDGTPQLGAIEKVEPSGGDGKPDRPKEYTASLHCSPEKNLPREWPAAILELERLTEHSIFLLIQGRDSMLDDALATSIMGIRKEISERRNIMILLDSGGGIARAAYKIAKIFKEQCDSFGVLVPRWAKSAATLLSLGADKLLLGKFAELGPLDAQYWDPERETTVSALDEVQALERLQAFSMDVVDRTMFLLVRRASKKVETLLPLICWHRPDSDPPNGRKLTHASAAAI